MQRTLISFSLCAILTSSTTVEGNKIHPQFAEVTEVSDSLKKHTSEEATNQSDFVDFTQEKARGKPVIHKASSASFKTQSPSSSQISKAEGIVVSPQNTIAWEGTPKPLTPKRPRLITGILTRDIVSEDRAYPIQIQSHEGRLIAYVNLSEIFISDLSPYINQKVYLRGVIYPLVGNSSRLVIIADNLSLAE